MDEEGHSMMRLAVLEEAAVALTGHLDRKDGREEGAFCLVREGKGVRGRRLLVTEVLLPLADAWERQSNGLLRPSAKWVSSAVSRAIEAKSGLMFVHSHPDAAFPTGFSFSDTSAFVALVKTLAPMLDGLFAAAVVHPDGWQGYVWSGGKLTTVDRLESVGPGIRFLSSVKKIQSSALDARQEDALGVVHHVVRNLTVAVIGVGGLRSPVAEQLVRMGVAEVILVDCDLLDTDSNIRRVFGDRMRDLRKDKPQPKAEIVARYLNGLGLGVRVRPVVADIRREMCFREALDADAVIGATDTHGSRVVISDLASAYLLPVIDVGVRVGQKADAHLSGLLTEVRLLTPTRPCLWCRGTVNADVVREENLPAEERERLVQEGYLVNGVGAPVPGVTSLTVLGSGLATSAVLGLLSDETDVMPSGYWFDGLLGDSCVTQPKEPKQGCRCRLNLGMGDSAAPPFMD